MIKVGFKRLTETAQIPTKAHETDSGFDLYADEDVIIPPGETRVIKTGIAIRLPIGFEGQIRPRSGVTSKTKLRVQLGTIDNSYTGEIGIIVDNISHQEGEHPLVQRGDRIAQLVLAPVPMVETYEIEKLPNTERGANGFGSSGY